MSAKRDTKRDEKRKLAEEARLFDDWLAWHCGERKSVLAGPHSAMRERLFFVLKSLELRSARVLLAFVRGVDWTAIDAATRLIILQEIDSAVAALRIRHSLVPFDDVPGARERVRHRAPAPVSCVRNAAPPGAKPGFENKSTPEHKEPENVE